MPVVKLFESLGLPIVFGQVFEHLIGLRAQVDRFTRSQQRSPPTGTNSHIDITGTVTTVPEPATVVLLGSGLAGVGAAIRKRRKSHRDEAG